MTIIKRWYGNSEEYIGKVVEGKSLLPSYMLKTNDMYIVKGISEKVPVINKGVVQEKVPQLKEIFPEIDMDIFDTFWEKKILTSYTNKESTIYVMTFVHANELLALYDQLVESADKSDKFHEMGLGVNRYVFPETGLVKLFLEKYSQEKIKQRIMGDVFKRCLDSCEFGSYQETSFIRKPFTHFSGVCAAGNNKIMFDSSSKLTLYLTDIVTSFPLYRIWDGAEALPAIGERFEFAKRLV